MINSTPMYIKIYFDDRPLFLCDEMTDEIRAYAHHDDAILIDEFSLVETIASAMAARRRVMTRGAQSRTIEGRVDWTRPPLWAAMTRFSPTLTECIRPPSQP